jgi:MoaA/NifB/PqqE/SkfB family radical SAM enzyme
MAAMLSRFSLRLGFYPLLACKILGWHLLHIRKVMSYRGNLKARQVIDEREVLSVNAAVLALRSASLALNPSTGKKNRTRKLLGKLFRFYISVVERLGKNSSNHTDSHRHVDHIIFQVTNICNAKCKQCFVLHELNKDVQRNLSLEEVEKFFVSLGRVRNIVLGGGEPFLRKDLDRVCISLDHISQPELITIPTNGAYSEIILQKVKNILENTRTSLKISLSVDGLPATHDEIRRVPGLFRNVKETYDKLGFLYYIFFPRLSLQVNTTVFEDNHAQMLQLYSLVKGNFPLAQFTFEAIRGHYDESSCRPIGEELYGTLVNSLGSLQEIRETGQLELHELAMETARRRTQVVPCIGGANFIVLDFFGNLYPCEILPSVTNIRDIQYDFRRVLADPSWTKAIQDIRQAKCHCTHMCFLSASLDEAKKKTSQETSIV